MKVLDFCAFVIYLTFLCTASFYYCMSLMWSSNWYVVCCDWRVGCASSGFRRELHENCVLLGYYIASSGNSLSTFRDNLSVPSSRIGCPKTSVGNYHYPLHNSSEDRSSRRVGRSCSAWQPVTLWEGNEAW